MSPRWEGFRRDGRLHSNPHSHGACVPLHHRGDGRDIHLLAEEAVAGEARALRVWHPGDRGAVAAFPGKISGDGHALHHLRRGGRLHHSAGNPHAQPEDGGIRRVDRLHDCPARTLLLCLAQRCFYMGIEISRSGSSEPFRGGWHSQSRLERLAGANETTETQAEERPNPWAPVQYYSNTQT